MKIFLGYFGAPLIRQVDPADLDRPFWSMAREATKILHDRVQADKWKDIFRAKPADPNSLRRHFLMGNVGNLGDIDSDYFQIEYGSAHTNINPENVNRLFANYFHTVGKSQLVLNVQYNSFFIESSIVDNYIRLIQKLIRNVSNVKSQL